MNLSKKLIEASLYEKINLTNDEQNVIYQILDNNLNGVTEYYDTFCPYCKLSTTFRLNLKHQVKSDNRLIFSLYNSMEKQYFLISYECSRNSSHTLLLTIKVYKEAIEKVGQSPSRANLDKNKFKKYSKVIDSEMHSELTRAIGLFSHGVGIGSFVYLRRIIERLVFKAFEKAKVDNPSIEKDFYPKDFDLIIFFDSGSKNQT